MQTNNHTYALIMAGGAGTRLWPMSRASLPKQFQPLLGTETPFQHMVSLTKQVIPVERIFVMAVPEFHTFILEQVPGLPKENILWEPSRRDTGPAITLGMLQIELRDTEAQVAILWSDHRIEKRDAFKTALEAAFEVLTDYPDHLIAVGAKPTRPDTGLGYIQMSKELGTYCGVRVFTAENFIEKPNFQTAKEFVSSWKYLWNVGYSITTTKTFFHNLDTVQPDLKECVENLKKILSQPEINQADLAEGYELLPKMSIDYMVTQKLTKLAAVPADMGWSDIGSWEILHEVLSGDQEDGLITQGPVTTLQTTNSLVYAKDKPIALIGMQDVIVVDTGDTILVMHRKAPSSLVKEFTSQLSITNPELL